MSSLYETLHSNPQIFISVRQWGTWPNLEQFQKKTGQLNKKMKAAAAAAVFR